MKKNKITYNLHDKDTRNRVNKAIKKEKERDGLWKTKQQITDKKYNDYCKKISTKNTAGGWKNKVYSVGKSQWQREWETNYDEMARKYREDKRSEVKIKTHKAVILYDEDGNYDAYEGEIEKCNGEIIVKIIYDNKKLPVKVEKPSINDINEELWKIALVKNADIYKLA